MSRAGQHNVPGKKQLDDAGFSRRQSALTSAACWRRTKRPAVSSMPLLDRALNTVCVELKRAEWLPKVTRAERRLKGRSQNFIRCVKAEDEDRVLGSDSGKISDDRRRRVTCYHSSILSLLPFCLQCWRLQIHLSFLKLPCLKCRRNVQILRE